VFMEGRLSLAAVGTRPRSKLIAKNYKWLHGDASAKLGERTNQARQENKKISTRHGGHPY